MGLARQTGPRQRSVIGMLAALWAGGLPEGLGIGAARADGLDAAAACAPRVALAGRVAAISNADIVLAGGAVVTLPGLRLGGPDALSALVGQPIEVRAAEQPDRWGRVPATATIVRPGGEAVWLEARLVANGEAIVAPRPGQGCAAALLAREAAARAARRGLWAAPAGRPVVATDLAALRARAGQFALVEGRVIAASQRGATIYLNFGRTWREDFTVRIATRDRRTFQRAGLDPLALAGRTVRVRGHLEERGGPSITAAVPDQIERLEAHR